MQHISSSAGKDNEAVTERTVGFYRRAIFLRKTACVKHFISDLLTDDILEKLYFSKKYDELGGGDAARYDRGEFFHAMENSPELKRTLKKEMISAGMSRILAALSAKDSFLGEAAHSYIAPELPSLRQDTKKIKDACTRIIRKFENRRKSKTRESARVENLKQILERHTQENSSMKKSFERELRKRERTQERRAQRIMIRRKRKDEVIVRRKEMLNKLRENNAKMRIVASQQRETSSSSSFASSLIRNRVEQDSAAVGEARFPRSISSNAHALSASSCAAALHALQPHPSPNTNTTTSMLSTQPHSHSLQQHSLEGQEGK